MDKLKLLSGGDIAINDLIAVHPPLLSEIREIGEHEYFCGLHSLCATPSDYKVPLLDDYDIDWEELSDYEFFLMNRRNIGSEVSKLLLRGIDICEFLNAQKTETKEKVLCSPDGSLIIDEVLYLQIVGAVRDIHGLKNKKDIAGNVTTKEYMLRKERRLLQRRKNKPFESILSPIVSALVNTSGFKYDYRTVFELNIFQITDALQSIRKEKSHTSLMRGVYAGTIEAKKLSQDALQWP